MSEQLTNEAVSERIGLSHSAVSRMRRGERIASMKTIVRISTEFPNVTIDELTRAAAAASGGDKGPWIALMASAFAVPSREHVA